MTRNLHPRESGQSMVLIALMIFTFVAMLALVLDGGLAYASRRKAQNAADAGALAGASELCATGNATSAKNVAETYAMVNNEASLAAAVVDGTLKTVTVNAWVDYTTTFARIFGINSGTAAATAAAACSPVCGGTGVLPILWTCKAPVTGAPSPTCAINYGPSNLYIIWDNLSYDDDTLCISEGGATDCDISVPPDGIDDTLAEKGGRSWMNLCGDSSFCSYNLADIIQSDFKFGPPPPVTTHMWFSGQTGISDGTLTDVKALIGKRLRLPVYDTFCLKSAGTCPVMLHAEDINHTAPNPNQAWHIHELASFVITCVRAGKDDVCTAADKFIADNATMKFLDSVGEVNSFRSIEGYFLEDYSSDSIACNPGSGTIDVGNYTITLLP